MLKKVFDRAKLQKRIAVCTSSEALTAVLEGLVASWGFELCSQDDPSVLLLAEEGCCELVEGQKSICLSRSHEPGPDAIHLPISIESLWHILEVNFHHPQRLHLRMAIELPVRVLLRGEWFDTTLQSLSDMGARFTIDRETVKQEPVTIELLLDGEELLYHGQVIFSMAGGSASTETFQTGMVFVGQDTNFRNRLRFVLIRWYLEAVRDGMDRQLFQSGLEFLDLAPEVRRALT